VLHHIEKYHDLRDKPIMDRKNFNRDSKKLRVWQDATALDVLACKIFTNFPFKLKKVASNSSYAFLTIIPCRRHKTSVVKSYMFSICYRNSETLIIIIFSRILS
jgi:hypothetical protein